MSDRVYLVGSEDVSRAGSQMRDAAESISRSWGNQQYMLQRLDQMVDRFEAAVDRLITAMEAKP